MLCDVLKTKRHGITLLDTKNSRQPVFLVEEEEKEQGKQSDTTDYQDILFDLRTSRFCLKSLIT